MANKKRRGKRAKKNPVMRKGKTNRWMKVKAVRVVRNKGRMIVEVRR